MADGTEAFRRFKLTAGDTNQILGENWLFYYEILLSWCLAAGHIDPCVLPKIRHFKPKYKNKVGSTAVSTVRHTVRGKITMSSTRDVAER